VRKITDVRPVFVQIIIGGFYPPVIRLDYLSCCLTVLSTILVARKQWSGLALASVNCVIVCLIGLRTSQFGFIPANLFCIAIYGSSIRSWLKDSRRAQTSPSTDD
jgi:hypothetical protein